MKMHIHKSLQFSGVLVLFCCSMLSRSPLYFLYNFCISYTVSLIFGSYLYLYKQNRNRHTKGTQSSAQSPEPDHAISSASAPVCGTNWQMIIVDFWNHCDVIIWNLSRTRVWCVWVFVCFGSCCSHGVDKELARSVDGDGDGDRVKSRYNHN